MNTYLREVLREKAVYYRSSDVTFVSQNSSTCHETGSSVTAAFSRQNLLHSESHCRWNSSGGSSSWVRELLTVWKTRVLTMYWSISETSARCGCSCSLLGWLYPLCVLRQRYLVFGKHRSPVVDVLIPASGLTVRRKGLPAQITPKSDFIFTISTFRDTNDHIYRSAILYGIV